MATPASDPISDGSSADKVASNTQDSKEGSIDYDYEDRLPTDEERKTLRLVADRIPIAAILIAVVEFGRHFLNPTRIVFVYTFVSQPNVPRITARRAHSAILSRGHCLREGTGPAQPPKERS